MIHPRHLPHLAVLLGRLGFLRVRLLWGCWRTGATTDDLRREVRVRRLRGDLLGPPREKSATKTEAGAS